MKPSKRIFLWVGLLLLGGPLFPEAIDPSAQSSAQAPPTVFRFDQDAPGRMPAGFSSAETRPNPKAPWEIRRTPRAPSMPNVLQAQAGPAETGGHMILVNGLSLENGEATVKFKIMGESGSQSLGFVYRYQSPSLYHLAAVEAKDMGSSLYRIRKGKVKQLDNQPVIVTADLWHTLQIVFRQSQYRLYVDGELVMAGKDKTDLRAGQIGLWAAGNTTAQFDDLTIAP